MGISHLLEDFGAGRVQDMADLGEGALEDLRLDAYEDGYKAGWDDAVTAQEGDTRRISSDFAGNLANLSFTYEEALQGMLRDLRPLLEEMVSKVLPPLAQDSLGPRISELLLAAAQDGAKPPIEIVAAPEHAEMLERLCEETGTLRVSLKSEPTLGPGQVHLSFGTREHELNLDRLLSDISDAVATFFDALPQQDQKETA